MIKRLALLALMLPALLPLLARAQEAAPVKPKAPITMAGKHEISFNLRNLSFTEVNNSILGLAYRYHWNEKWNLRVQADVGLSMEQRRGEFSPDSLGNSSSGMFGHFAFNTYNYAFLVGIERSRALGPGYLFYGLNLGFGVVGQDQVSYGGFILTNPRIINRTHISSYRFRPSLAYRWQINRYLSATVETQLNFEYSVYDVAPPGFSGSSAKTYRLNISSIPISSLTFNVHF